MATFLAEVCTLDGRLPQGAPTSPKISNFVMTEVDEWLHQMAQEMGCVYTRYADDITFSSNSRIPIHIVSEIDGALQRLGLRLNEAKTRFMGANQRKEVTGLVLGADGVALPRKYLNGTRGWFHSISQIPDFYTDEIARVAGTITLLRQVGGRGTERLIAAGETAMNALRAVSPKIKW